MDKEQIKQKLKEVLEQDEKTLFAFLFGSLVRGDDIESSDVDVGVYLRDDQLEDKFDEKLRLTNLLSEKLRRDVDVVILNRAAPLMKFEMYINSELILEKDKGKRLDFLLKAVNEYHDYRPYLEMYNERTLNDSNQKN
ncbi:MAG: nucleotidyltransferase domain-containing protein [Candidatus Paceibacteria bacterium]